MCPKPLDRLLEDHSPQIPRYAQGLIWIQGLLLTPRSPVSLVIPVAVLLTQPQFVLATGLSVLGLFLFIGISCLSLSSFLDASVSTTRVMNVPTTIISVLFARITALLILLLVTPGTRVFFW